MCNKYSCCGGLCYGPSQQEIDAELQAEEDAYRREQEGAEEALAQLDEREKP